MMNKITVDVPMEIEVTDEEYEKLRVMACGDERTEDNPYNDILVPEWVMKKVRESGKLVGESGIIYRSTWITTPYDEFEFDLDY